MAQQFPQLILLFSSRFELLDSVDYEAGVEVWEQHCAKAQFLV